MDTSEIERKATEVLALTRQPEKSKAVDVISIAKKYGFLIGNTVLEDDSIDGLIIINEGKNIIDSVATDMLICVNTDRTLEWKRFIVAHELGHYFLDYKDNKEMRGLFAHRDHKRGHSDSENNIDYFAASLLMPRKEFAEKYNELKQSGANSLELRNMLAEFFVVTKPMAERRIDELELA